MAEAKRFTPGEIAVVVRADPQWTHYLNTECTVVADIAGDLPFFQQIDYALDMCDGKRMFCIHEALARKKPPYTDFNTKVSWKDCHWQPGQTHKTPVPVEISERVREAIERWNEVIRNA